MARIMVVGAGVVGKATGISLVEHDHDVSFVDVNKNTRSSLVKEGYATLSPEDMNLNGTDAIFVSVTALTGQDGVDLTHLMQATENIGKRLAETTIGFPVVVYRCTMPPGTVRWTLAPFLEKMSGKQAGKDFGIVYNPEYLRANSALEDFCNPRVVTLASFEEHDRAHDVVRGIMRDFGVTMHWVPLEVAEFQKYVNNVYNAIKISAFNWFRSLADKLGIDPTEAFELSTLSAEGLWNPVYGTHDFGPYGGACLPKDTKALRHFASKLGVDVSLLDAVMDINRSHGGA